jgi:hypothetical protein
MLDLLLPKVHASFACRSTKAFMCAQYMTDGVLLRESLREPDLDNYR